MATNDVAVFVDFENIYISIRNKYGEQPNFDSIREKCQEYGRVTIARAYADWYRYPRVTNALYANSIEPMYVPTYYYDREEGRMGRAIKNSVDIHMCIDCMKTLYTHPNIETYVIITGDRDFIPLINAIRQQGKRAIVIGVPEAASSHLAQSADEFIFYNQIVNQFASKRAEEEEPEEEVEEVAKPTRPARKEREKEKEKDYFDTLVQAIKLARQRGNLATLATLKLLMVEILGDFDETRLRDKNGKAYEKFRDFVKEAERRKYVQIFSSGSVTEVYLPGEDPLKLSQFVLEPFEDDMGLVAAAPPTTDKAADATPGGDGAQAGGRGKGRRRKGKGTPTAEPTAPAAEVEEPTAEAETGGPFLPDLPEAPAAEAELGDEAPDLEDIGDREWNIFSGMMSQFDQPILFIEIFDSLRALRNKEILDLSNKQMKDLIKEAINRKMLLRSARGNHAYYRLNPDWQLETATE